MRMKKEMLYMAALIALLFATAQGTEPGYKVYDCNFFSVEIPEDYCSVIEETSQPGAPQRGFHAWAYWFSEECNMENAIIMGDHRFSAQVVFEVDSQMRPKKVIKRLVTIRQDDPLPDEWLDEPTRHFLETLRFKEVGG